MVNEIHQYIKHLSIVRNDNLVKTVTNDKVLADNFKIDQRVDAKRRTREMLEKEAIERKQREELEVSKFQFQTNFEILY